MFESRHLAVVISVIAIAISASSLYITGIRRQELLSISQEWFNRPLVVGDDIKLHGQTVGSILAINSGNTPIEININSLQFVPGTIEDENKCYSNEVATIHPEQHGYIIKPQDMEIININIESISRVINLRKEGIDYLYKNDTGVKYKDEMTICLQMRYTTMTENNVLATAIIGATEAGNNDDNHSGTNYMIFNKAIIQNKTTFYWPEFYKYIPETAHSEHWGM